MNEPIKPNKIDWELVDDSFREVTRNKFLKNEVTEALLGGKTIKLTGSSGDSFYRWAKANNYDLHRRMFGDFVIMWITPQEGTA